MTKRLTCEDVKACIPNKVGSSVCVGFLASRAMGVQDVMREIAMTEVRK